MKWAVALAVLLTLSCAGRKIDVDTVEKVDPDFPVNADGVMRIFTKDGFAHACPADGIIWSAGHVIEREGPFRTLLRDYTWSDERGGFGYLEGYLTLPTMDLGVFHLSSGDPAYYAIAKELPEPGDRLYWIELDYSGIGNLFLAKKRSAEFVRIISKHMVMDELPNKGASGGCLFNEDNDVVGIVTWRLVGGIAISLVAESR